jgi:hypothetical protein
MMPSYKLAPSNEAKLKEPEMPNLKTILPQEFIQKINDNHAYISTFEKRAATLEEKQ